MNPGTAPLNQRTTGVPATLVSQQPYTDAYNDFSSSIIGQTLGFPGTNNLIQEGLLAGEQIGSGLASAGRFLTKPRKRLPYAF